MTRRPKTGVGVGVKRLPHGKGLPLPAYQSPKAAGLDLLAAIPADNALILGPGARALVPTGLVIALPEGYEGQVRPRSGLALRHGVTVLNSPGTIDADYRGEVMVLLVNLGATPFRIARGERIAQLVVAPVTHAELLVTATLSPTQRGRGGFGSTGTDAPKGIANPAKPKKKAVPSEPAPRQPRTPAPGSPKPVRPRPHKRAKRGRRAAT